MSSIYKVMALPYMIVDPIKTYIHCFGSFLFHGFVGDATGHAVVGDHRDEWLGVDQSFKFDSYWRTFFAIVEKGG